MPDRFAVPADLLPSSPAEFELEKFANSTRAPQATERQQPGPWIDISGRQADYSNYKLSGDTSFSDYTRGFGKGLVDIVGSLLGVVEMTGAVKPGTFTGATDKYAQEIVANMSPSARKNLERQWTDVGEEGILQNPKAALQQLATVAPSVLASLVPAAAVAGAASKAGKAVEVARALGSAAGVGSEALQVTGATYNDIRTTMDGMTHDQLMQSAPQYVKAFKKHGDEAEARQELLLGASRSASVANGLWAALVAAPGAGLAAKFGTGAKTFTGTKKGRFAKGFALEGAEEVAQEIPGQILTGKAIQGNIDPTRDPYANLLETGVASFMLGGGVGGPLGVLTGGQESKSPPPSRDVPDDVRAAVDAYTPPEQPQQQDQWSPSQMPFAPEMGQMDYQPGLDEQVNYQPPPPAPPREPAPFTPGQGAANTNAEPLQDIRAQVWQMLYQDTNKKAVYISPEDVDDMGQFPEERLTTLSGVITAALESAGAAQRYPNLDIRRDSHGGMVIALDGKDIDAYTAAGETDAARAALLGYVQSKEQFQNPDQTVTVLKRNPDTGVAESQTVDLEMQQAAVDALSADLLEGQTIEVLPTGVMLAQRAQRVWQELNTGDATLREGVPPYQPESTARTEPLTGTEHTQTSGLARTSLTERGKPKGKRQVGAVEEKPLAETKGQLPLPGVPEPRESDITAKQRQTEAAQRQAERELGRSIGETVDETAEYRRRQMTLPLGYENEARAYEKKRVKAASEEKQSIRQQSAKDTALFREFKAAFESLVRDKTNRQILSDQQIADITEWINSQTKAGKVQGITKQDALEQIDAVLAESDSSIKAFISSAKKRGKVTPRPAPKVSETPADNYALQEGKDVAARNQQVKSRLQKVKARRERKKAWEKRKATGEVKENPNQKQLLPRVQLLKTIRKMLVDKFGLTEAEAKTFDINSRHLAFPFPMGAPTSEKTNKFKHALLLLRAAMESGDPTKVLSLLNERGRDAIAKLLVQGELKLPGGKAYAKVNRWKKNRAKEPMSDTLRARLELLYSGDVAAALTAEDAELARLIAEQAADMKGKQSHTPKREVTGVNLDKEVEGGQAGKPVQGTPTPSRGKKEKTATDQEFERIKRAVRSNETPAGTGPDGEGVSASFNGQPREPRLVIGPTGGFPEPVAATVFSAKYPRLSTVQAQGVNNMLQRVISNPDGSKSVLADGTGVGKTSQMLVLAAEFRDRFVEQHGRAPRILIVTPSQAIYKNFAAEAKELGLFNADVGTTKRKASLDGIDNVNYYGKGRTLKTVAGESYDLVIYDEAQAISKTNQPHKDHLKINAKHTVYATATPGDKEENLALVALVHGKTLLEFLRQFDPGVQTTVDIKNEEIIDVTSIRNKLAFYQKLAETIGKLADAHGYLRRELPRTAKESLLTLTKADLNEETLVASDGKRMTMPEIEDRHIAWLGKQDTFNESALWDFSMKLSERAKVPHVIKQVELARKNNEQAIVLFYSWQEKEESSVIPVGTDEKGNTITVTIPPAIELLQQRLADKYGEKETVRITGREKERATVPMERFQKGEHGILLSTYQSVGTGFNLDANVAAEDGGRGRRLILVSDDWSADTMDQAVGRVDRASTKINANVTRMHSDMVGDLARQEKLMAKEQLQAVFRNGDMAKPFSYENNIRVTQRANGSVGVRMLGLNPQSKEFLRVKQLLDGARYVYKKETREHIIPADQWTPELQEAIALTLELENAPVQEPTPAPRAEPAQKKESKPKTKKAAPPPAADTTPDLDALTVKELTQRTSELEDQLGKATGEEFERINSELDDVYRALERKASDRQSHSRSSIGPFSNDSTDYTVEKGIKNADSLPTILREMARSPSLPPVKRKFLRKLAKFADRTKLVAVTPEAMRRIGYKDAAGLYRGVEDTIYLDEVNAESLIHETLHAVMMHAIRYDGKVRQAVQDMMDAVHKQFLSEADTISLTNAEISQWRQALGDMDEFVSYGLTNQKIHRLLARTPSPNQPSLMKRLLNAILNFLGMRNPVENRNIADDLEDLVTRNMSHDRVADNITLKMMSSRLGEETMEQSSAFVDALSNVVANNNLPSSLSQWNAAVRRKALGFGTLRQIDSIYSHVLKDLPAGNPVGKLLEALHQRQVEQNKFATLGNDMHRDYVDATRAEDGAYRTDIETLIGESTFGKIWVNKPLDHADNAHLDEEGKADWKRLRALYEKNKVIKNIYDKVFKYYEDERRENFTLRIRNIVDALNQTGVQVYYRDAEGNEEAITADNAKEIIAPNLLSKEPSYDPDNFYVKDPKTGDVDDGVSSLLSEAIANDHRATLSVGPYAPLKRFGDWMVSVYKGETSFTAALDDTELQGIRDRIRRRMERRLKKDMENWNELDTKLYTTEVNRTKRKLLKSKLRKQGKEKWGSTPSVEFDLIEFNDSVTEARQKSRQVSFHLQESEENALRLLRTLTDEGWETAPGYKVARKLDVSTSGKVPNSALLNHLRSKLESGENRHPIVAALEASIIDLMPETSAQKEMLHRKNIYGYDTDHGRALAAHVQSASWYRATLMVGKQINRAMTEMTAAEAGLSNKSGEYKYTQSETTKVQDVLKEVRKHVNADAKQNQLGPISKFIGQTGFLWMLLSPAYVFINLTQPTLYTLPWLKARQKGGMPAWRAFKNAYAAITPEIARRAGVAVSQITGKLEIDPDLFDFLQRGEGNKTVLNYIIEKRLSEAARDGKLNSKHLPGLKTMLETLSENNVLDFTLALDTSAAAQGRSAESRFMDVARILPHLSEVLNRAVTAIAAYEMGKSQNMTDEQATEFATQAVVETQFDYTLLNKPRFMSERFYSLAKPVFMFMQHPQHVYALFVHAALTGGRYARLKRSGEFNSSNPEHRALEKEWKERRDTIIGILQYHMLAGGLTAAMFEPTKWALGLALLISEAISGEPPEDTEVYVRRWLNNTFGEDFGRILSDGLPSAVGLHFSDNLSVSNLLTMKTLADFGGGREGVEGLMMSIGGPLPNIVANAAQGYQDIRDGDTWGGLSKMTPRLLREPLKAYGMATSGLRDSNGNPIVNSDEFTPLELAAMTLGLRTTKVAKAWERKGALEDRKAFHRAKRKRLSERLYRAYGNPAATAKVVSEIRAYNKSLPIGAPPLPTVVSPGKFKSAESVQKYGAVLSNRDRWMAENL